MSLNFQKIKLLGLDVDGVLTDGSISYTSTGAEIKTFNAKDGQGIAMLTKLGINVAIITARSSLLSTPSSFANSCTFIFAILIPPYY